jgi:transcriptional regulator with XRE-family HTH domain
VVKDLRERKQLSVATVAAGAGLTSERVRQIESGADEPTLLEIFRIAIALDVHAHELVHRAVEGGKQP